ncbi:hypothetical protein HDU96_002030, partial [Phlyctochytrium bullatum]
LHFPPTGFLGAGGTAGVYVAKDTMNPGAPLVAVKVARSNALGGNPLTVEISMLSKLEKLLASNPQAGPRVFPQLFDSGKFISWKGRCWMYSFYTMEMMATDLLALAKNSLGSVLNKETAAGAALSILEALRIMHGIGHVHNNIKPGGVSTYGAPPRKVFWTPIYASIEMHKDSKTSAPTDDFWGLFYTILALLKGGLPWQDAAFHDMARLKWLFSQNAKSIIGKDLPELMAFHYCLHGRKCGELHDFEYDEFQRLLRDWLNRIAMQQSRGPLVDSIATACGENSQSNLSVAITPTETASNSTAEDNAGRVAQSLTGHDDASNDCTVMKSLTAEEYEQIINFLEEYEDVVPASPHNNLDDLTMTETEPTPAKKNAFRWIMDLGCKAFRTSAGDNVVASKGQTGETNDRTRPKTGFKKFCSKVKTWCRWGSRSLSP